MLLGLAAASTVFAQGFTGTYELGRASELPAQDLDFAPFVIPLRQILYPQELRGITHEASIGVVVWVKEDGVVNRVLVTHGTDVRLREQVQLAVEDWRFTPPMKDAKPVPALVRFRVRFSEKEIRNITFELPERPNK